MQLQSLLSCYPLSWIIYYHPLNQIYQLLVTVRVKLFQSISQPRSFNFCKLHFTLFQFHALKIRLSRRSYALDDSRQHCSTVCTLKKRMIGHHLGNHTSHRPYIHLVAVVDSSEEQLRRPVVPRTNVRYIFLPHTQYFC